MRANLTSRWVGVEMCNASAGARSVMLRRAVRHGDASGERERKGIEMMCTALRDNVVVGVEVNATDAASVVPISVVHKLLDTALRRS